MVELVGENKDAFAGLHHMGMVPHPDSPPLAQNDHQLKAVMEINADTLRTEATGVRPQEKDQIVRRKGTPKNHSRVKVFRRFKPGSMLMNSVNQNFVG
jgi:hypothetical protein